MRAVLRVKSEARFVYYTVELVQDGHCVRQPPL